MNTTLDRLDFKSNGIGFLRLLLASAVVWSHGLILVGREPVMLYSHEVFSVGYLAVGGFFALSGFLVTRSGESLRDPARFMWHRIVRIYPGFWMCLFVTAFVFAPIAWLMESGTIHGYFSSPDGPFSYIFRNAIFFYVQSNIANLVPSTGEFPDQINISLWTLPWELACYICVALFGFFSVYRAPRIVPIATFVLLLAVFVIEAALRHSQVFQYIKPLYLFVVFGLGSTAYLFRRRIPMHWVLAVSAGVIIIGALPTPFSNTLLPVPIAYLILYAATFLPIRSFDRYVDLSYGLYIYSMPIELLLALLHLQRFGLGVYVGCSLTVGLAFAAASWYLVESQALKLKNWRWGLDSRPS